MSMLEVIFVLHKNESKMYVLNYEKGAYLSEISHIPPKLPHFFPRGYSVDQHKFSQCRRVLKRNMELHYSSKLVVSLTTFPVFRIGAGKLVKNRRLTRCKRLCLLVQSAAMFWTFECVEITRMKSKTIHLDEQWTFNMN